MRLTSVRALCLVIALGALSDAGIASPSFNTNRPNLQKNSREAGAMLNDGLAASHTMFKFLEYQSFNEANSERNRAVQFLKDAKVKYEGLVKQAPDQDLVMRPSTDDEKSAEQDFRKRLAEAKIEQPKTERQLAAIAVTVVTQHLKLLDELKFKGGRDDNERLRALIHSQATLLELGILTTIAWDISTPSLKR